MHLIVIQAGVAFYNAYLSEDEAAAVAAALSVGAIADVPYTRSSALVAAGTAYVDGMRQALTNGAARTEAQDAAALAAIMAYTATPDDDA